MNGLAYLHSQSVIHRDIKPGNVLISIDGIVKLTDFGIAEINDPYVDGSLKSRIYSGTAEFLAPEVLKSGTFDGVKVDIYASGVVLYNMISGQLPYAYDADFNLDLLHQEIIAGFYLMPEEAIFPLNLLIRGKIGS